MVHLGELSQPDVPTGLTKEEKEFARQVFAGEAKDTAGGAILACVYCGGLHTRVFGQADRQQVCCPRIKSIQFSATGALLSVEFWPNGRWEENVVFPVDAAD